MILHVRKGLIFVELDFHANGACSIGAKFLHVEPRPHETIFRLQLSPVDGNQREDERWLDEAELLAIRFDDQTSVKEASRLLASTHVKSANLVLEIISRGALLRFPVTAEFRRDQVAFYVAPR